MRFRSPIKIPNRTGDFARNYRLPLWSTLGLIVIVMLLILLRTYEQSVIAGVLGNKSSTSSDYARLLSKDKDAELNKNKTTEGENSSQATPTTTTTNSSLTISSSTGVTTTPSGGTTASPPGDTNGIPEPPPEPFSSQLSGFGLRSQSSPIACDNSGASGMQQLCQQYDFVASVNTFNGPGVVKHELRWTGVENGNMSGKFQATSGDAFKQVYYTLKIKCDESGQYNFRFVITQPAFAESQQIPVSHNCHTTGDE